MIPKQKTVPRVKTPDYDDFLDEDLGEIFERNRRLKRKLLNHVWIYIGFNLGAIIFNIFTSLFFYPIFVIGAFVWLIGLGEHITAYRIKSRDVSPKSKKGFYYHLGTFLSSIPLLILGYLTIIAIPIWGIFVIIHYILFRTFNTTLIRESIELSNYDTTPKYGGFSEAQLRIIAVKKIRETQAQ